MTGSERNDLERTVAVQIEKLRAEGKLDRQPSKRCRVCKDDNLRMLVNMLVGKGCTIRDVLSILNQAGVNAPRPKNDQITYTVVWNHINNHYDVQAPSAAVYRHIRRLRAKEEGRDLDTAIGGEVNYLAYLDTVMFKGYEHLVAEDTVVNYADGMKAAREIHEMTRQDAGVAEAADIIARQNRIIAAMREVVPAEYHPAILARIEGREPPSDAVVVDVEDEGFTPPTGTEDED